MARAVKETDVPAKPTHSLDAERIFTAIHESNGYCGTESRSGEGSTFKATECVRTGLQQLLQVWQIEHLLDVPCGDWNWMRYVDMGACRYTGGDIVRELVNLNTRLYGNAQRQFIHINLLTDPLPDADLLFCRDCLVHMSHADVLQALRNIRRANIRWLMATTFTARTENASIVTGQWTPYNLRAAPFNLPEPIYVLNEDCREYYPQFTDKCMAVWEVSDLAATD
jgi:hypothetical protein